MTHETKLQEGLHHHQSGRLAEAEKCYREILTQDSGHADALHLLGIVAQQSGRPEEAVRLIDQAIERMPENRVYYGNLANVYKNQNRWDKVEETLVRLLARAPDDAEVHNQLGESRQLQGRLTEAMDSYRKAIELNPANADYPYRMGNAQLALGQHREAETSYRQALVLAPTAAELHNNLGLAQAGQGRRKEAIESYREALRLMPDFAAAHVNLGNALSDAGEEKEEKKESGKAGEKTERKAEGKAERKAEEEEAIHHYREALRLEPGLAEAHNNLGSLLEEQGNLEEAIGCYLKALELKPAYADANYNLGHARHAQGKLEEAESSYRKALELDGSHARAYYNLGNALQEQARHEEAIESYERALELKSDYVGALCNRGKSLKELNRLDEAVESFRRALDIRPDDADIAFNLGQTLQAMTDMDAAVACYRRVLQLRPDDVDAHEKLGVALLGQGRALAAAESFRQVLQLRPADSTAHCNLGDALRDQGRLDDAVDCYRQALNLDAESVMAYNNLGLALQWQGNLQEAMDCYHAALKIKPDNPCTHSNVIFALDLKPGVGLPAAQAERRKWSEINTAGIEPVSCHENFPDPERRLRVGYVSADLRRHSAAVGFGVMLTHFDPEKFEVFVYENSIKRDEHTRTFMQHANGWRRIAGSGDEEVAAMIRDDEIDILVDLSGHSAGNRLRVFAMKPAPIQITAWGYAGGTGMKAMDALFSDRVIVPPEEKDAYAEEVRYLPSVISAYFPEEFPAITPLNAEKPGSVVFGSFNRLVKISDAVLATWAKILNALPESRMVLKIPELRDPQMLRRMMDTFGKLEVSESRLTLLGLSPWRDHVAAFNRIDILLDSFPQCGGVTTLESLMMGVPVVTLRGNNFVGRGSASILTTLGMEAWIAADEDAYVDLAVKHAADIDALATLRRELRQRFQSSILGDSKAYVRVVEAEYRLLWQRWCAKQRKAGAIGVR